MTCPRRPTGARYLCFVSILILARLRVVGPRSLHRLLPSTFEWRTVAEMMDWGTAASHPRGSFVCDGVRVMSPAALATRNGICEVREIAIRRTCLKKRMMMHAHYCSPKVGVASIVVSRAGSSAGSASEDLQQAVQ